MEKRNEKGFTLVELLVVMAIIGLLITIALVGLNIARENQRDTTRKAITQDIQTQIEGYYGNYGSYPAFACSGDTAAHCASGVKGAYATIPAVDALHLDADNAGTNSVTVDEGLQKSMTQYNVSTNTAYNGVVFACGSSGNVKEGNQNEYTACYTSLFGSNKLTPTGYGISVQLEGVSTGFCLLGGSGSVATSCN